MDDRSYHPLPIRDTVVLVRRDRSSLLAAVRGIVFDCDGVLIDARRSYEPTIERTVAFLTRQLCHLRLPRGFASRRVVQRFRDSGGFNNDWDTTYIILLALFRLLSRSWRNRFAGLIDMNNAAAISDPGRRLRYTRSRLRSVAPPVLPVRRDTSHSLETYLYGVADHATTRGIVDFETAWNIDASVRCLKTLLAYPGSVRTSLITRVFDELFYGASLFRRHTGLAAHLNTPGMIRYERPLVNETVLRHLRRWSPQGFGIASGRAAISATATLGSLFHFFPRPGRVFLEDALKQDPRRSGGPAQAKPDPYALAASAQGLGDPRPLLYVGDAQEDLLMAQELDEEAGPVLFAGVYGGAAYPLRRRSAFRQGGADLILPSAAFLADALSSCIALR